MVAERGSALSGTLGHRQSVGVQTTLHNLPESWEQKRWLAAPFHPTLPLLTALISLLEQHKASNRSDLSLQARASIPRSSVPSQRWSPMISWRLAALRCRFVGREKPWPRNDSVSPPRLRR